MKKRQAFTHRKNPSGIRTIFAICTAYVLAMVVLTVSLLVFLHGFSVTALSGLVMGVVCVASAGLVTWRLFDPVAGVLAATLIASHLPVFPSEFSGVHGVLILAPLLLFAMVSYYRNPILRIALITSFVCALMVYLHIPTGLLFGLIVTGYMIYCTAETGKYRHLFTLGAILAGCVPGVISDIAHQRMALSSAIAILGSYIDTSIPFTETIARRILGLVVDGLPYFRHPLIWFNILVSYIPVFQVQDIVSRKTPNKHKAVFAVAAYMYVMFWILSTIYTAVEPNLIILPAFTLPAIVLGALYGYIKKRIFIPLFCSIVLVNMMIAFEESWHLLSL